MTDSRLIGNDDMKIGDGVSAADFCIVIIIIYFCDAR